MHRPKLTSARPSFVLTAVLVAIAGCTPKQQQQQPPPTATSPCDPNPCTTAGKTVCTWTPDATPAFTCSCDTRFFQDDGAGGCQDIVADVDDPQGTLIDETTTPPTFTALVRVVDSNKAPIAGAKVSVADAAAVTVDATGIAKITKVRADQAVNVKASANGYAAAAVAVDVFSAGLNPVDITLAKFTTTRTMAADKGGQVSRGVASVEFAANSFLKKSGEPYSGMVTVQMAANNPGVTTEADESQLGRTADGTMRELTMRGTTYVRVAGADGQELVLAPDQPAIVHLPLPRDFAALPGDELSFWSFNETALFWERSSRCVVNALPEIERNEGRLLECVGTVPHFSPVAVELSDEALDEADEEVPEEETAAREIGSRRLKSGSYCLNHTLKVNRPSQYEVIQFKSKYVNAVGDKLGTDKANGTRKRILNWKFTYRTAKPKAPKKIYTTVTVRRLTDNRKLTIKQTDTLTVKPKFNGSKSTCPTFAQTIKLANAPVEVDEDHDGYDAQSDCNDSDPNVHPGATEIACNGVDDNCDGVTDPPVAYTDFTPDVWNSTCSATCMQKVAEIPGNAYDEDCDGVVSDQDDDHYLAVGDTFTASGYMAGDCNDREPSAHPGATEVPGNSIDEDCDGYALDQDGDGFVSGAALIGLSSEAQTKPDCNDFSADFHPGNTKSEVSLASFYALNETDQKVHRLSGFCELFEADGTLKAEARATVFNDYNCNGQPDDLDGDGWLPYPTAQYPTTWDCDDLDPRVFPVDGEMSACNPADASLVNDSTCSPDLKTFGGTARPLCPSVPGKEVEAQCTDLVDQSNVPWGVFVCQPTQFNFQDPIDPFAFGQLYGPCDFNVKLPACGPGLQCAGPMTFSTGYLETLKNEYDYDIASELPWLGICLQTCGNRCTVNPNPCTEPHKGKCTLVSRQATCGCDDGYELSNGSCVLKANACETAASACDNGGTCAVSGDSLTCSCAAGWEGPGCDRMTNNCLENPCAHDGVCTNQLNDFSCACPAGWSGKTCTVDVDECAASGVCDQNATCANSDGSYTCTCNSGYTGNGSVCQAEVAYSQPTYSVPNGFPTLTVHEPIQMNWFLLLTNLDNGMVLIFGPDGLMTFPLSEFLSRGTLQIQFWFFGALYQDFVLPS